MKLIILLFIFHRSTNHKLIPNNQNVEISDSVDSPYKHSLSKIRQVDSRKDDCDDFKTPPVFRKSSKLCPKQIIKNCKKLQSKSKAKTTRNSIVQSSKDKFRNLDVNADNLQMALALSKSTFEMEYPQNEDDIPNPPKSVKLGTVLERYGFKSGKPNLMSYRPKINLVPEVCI